MEDLPALVEVVQRRLDFLETLVGEPLRKHELVDALDCSRSTVNRAIDELEAETLVTRETDGYRTTLTGQLLSTGYRRFLTAATDVDAARDVLSPLGADADLSPTVLRSADTYRAAGPDPYRPLERLDRAVVDADTVDAALPTLPYPRLLDRCRAVAAGGGAVRLVMDDELYRHARTRFPADVASLAGQDGVEIRAGGTIDVGLVVADGTVITLVFDEERSLHGITESSSPEAVSWGRDRIRSLADAGDNVGDELAGLASASNAGEVGGTEDGAAGGAADGGDGERDGRTAGRRFVGTTGSVGSETLASQGFLTLDDDRLDGNPEPIGPLRAPASFAEVAAGYVLDRTVPGETGRYSLDDRLFEGLSDGRDHLLVGPAGSGKSTVCRSVAVRWHRSGRGPVLYRRGDSEEPFTAVESLRERISNAEGDVLVVVEDAVTPAAARTMAVARGLAGRSNVSFLFDARRDAYDDPDGLPLTPADLAYRRRIETIRMPRLDEGEVERFIDHVADVTGASLATDSAALLGTIRGRNAGEPGSDPGGRDDSDDPATAPATDGQGEVSRLIHRLASAATRPGDERGTLSSLEGEIARIVSDLDERPPPTMDVAVLINLLNVAGFDDVRSLAYVLLDAGSARDAGPSRATGSARDAGSEPTDSEAVRRALDRLEGTVLIPESDGSTRMVHEEWSVLFLERLLDREPEPVVARRVGRVLSRLLSLADEPARRSRIRRAFGGDAPAIDDIEADPVSWAETTVTAVYDVGRSYPRLAGLYGRVRYSWIDLPEACPDDLRERPPEWITRMYIDAGDLDRATEALDAWRPASAAGEAKRQRGFGDVARRRGEHDTALDHFNRAITLFEDTGDREGLADAVRGRGQAAHFAGEFETAYEASSRAYALAASLDDPIAVAKSLMNVANALDAMGDSETVIAHYRLAHELFQTYDDVHGEANVSTNLGVALRRRGDLSGARRAGRRALEGYRTVGDTHREAIVLVNLGAIAEQRGELGTARERYRTVESLAERTGSEPHRGFALNGLGSVALREHALDEAERLSRDALAAFEGIDADHRTAMVSTQLAEIAVERGDANEAERWLSRSAELLDDHAGRKRTAALNHVRGRKLRLQGDLPAAERALSSALEDAESGGFMDLKTRILATLGQIAAERGENRIAVDRLVTAIEQGTVYECETGLSDASDALESLVPDHELPGADREATGADVVREAIEAVGSGIEIDDDACRELAERWRLVSQSLSARQG
ncbi:tetratricopeptide (TPR) repeat protein/predicted transcriptional regulator [Halorubrum alkaliphilum]|uniref:Tetratricopeptide (TPR) repeat protein/predicted transcriptional regulator n=1 Tax=Halorubrum alkaliphilum TaxID=261290 RepID=A0A8T4GE55_9EURY|nr:tetratricopeptide repeat protein [Halorubrum alkaliphilum]MBP1922009.1 tetratricopeptide (TPR) repeat protein/predicted transcriptional regulator [Halorubrum alkaliphilum]